MSLIYLRFTDDLDFFKTFNTVDGLCGLYYFIYISLLYFQRIMFLRKMHHIKDHLVCGL